MANLVAIVPTAQTRSFARWRLLNGTVVETPLTDAEYAALGVKGAGEPPRGAIPETATWLCAASGRTVWDTPDGLLPFGGYERRGNQAVLGLDLIDPVFYRLRTGNITDLTAVNNKTFTVKGVSFRIHQGTVVKL